MLLHDRLLLHMLWMGHDLLLSMFRCCPLRQVGERLSNVLTYFLLIDTINKSIENGRNVISVNFVTVMWGNTKSMTSNCAPVTAASFIKE